MVGNNTSTGVAKFSANASLGRLMGAFGMIIPTIVH
jgi:hypothetical protein